MSLPVADGTSNDAYQTDTEPDPLNSANRNMHLSKGTKMHQKDLPDIEKTSGVTDTAGTEITSSAATGREALRPQPSNDPNDPLNWPRYQKWMNFFTICFFSFLATVNTSKHGVAILAIATEFNVDTNTAAFLVCFNVLALGLGNFFWVTALRIYGCRPVFLVALPMLAAFNVWSAKASSFGSLLGATILSGFASAAGEAPVSTVVVDLFFVHQRGTMMMIFHLSLSAGFFLGPAVNAAIVQYAGWRWICGWIAIASSVTWLIGIFTIHETAYYDRDVSAPASLYGPKKTSLKMLGVTSGYNEHLSLFAAVYRNIGVIGYPAILWAGLTVGTFVGWNVIVQVTATRVFSAQPYNFQLYSIGLLAIAGFIGSVVAMFFGGRLIDIVANRMTSKNHGRREPEYRLPAMILPSLIGPMGILIFGVCVARETHWVGAAFGYGMQGFGLTAASNVLVTYAVDSYPNLAGEALVVLFMIRGVSGCLLSLYAYDWIVAAGTENAFSQMVAVQYFFILLTILFLWYGRELRVFTASYGPMKSYSN